jgi:hypothetical protein
MKQKRQNNIPTEKAFVYLICDPAQNLFKIGVTKNLYSKRMKQLQTGNGTELHIVNYHETYYPFRIEAFLHKRFFSKNQHGEWFELTVEDIMSFEKYCQEYEKIIEELKDNPFFAKQLR